MSNCLLPGSKILLNNNTYKNIEDILINDIVKVFNLKTLKSTHNLRLLGSKKTTQFEGSLTKSIIKNIWVNHMDKYYILNDCLKITGEHFIFVKRDVEYYWTEVQNLILYLSEDLYFIASVNSSNKLQLIYISKITEKYI